MGIKTSGYSMSKNGFVFQNKRKNEIRAFEITLRMNRAVELKTVKVPERL